MTDYTPTPEDVRRVWSLRAPKDQRAQRDAEFDRMIAQVRAEAWDEGWNAGHYDYVSIQDGADLTKNPYRSDDDDD